MENEEQVKQMVFDAINQTGVAPETIIAVGQIAEQAINNKALYPMVKDAALRAGLAEKEDFGENIDYQILGTLAMLGKAASQMTSLGGTIGA